MAGIFIEPVGLSGCNKRAIYRAWGMMIQAEYPSFNDASCSYCDRITTSNITLGMNATSGMVSRINVTLNMPTGLPAGTALADLRAEPVTPPFAPVPFAPAAGSASKAAAGNLPFTGDWNVSFMLITNNKPEACPLPSQNVRCMPTFDDGENGCVCPAGKLNINGRCEPACPELNIVPRDSAVYGTSNSVITAILTASSQSVEIVAVPTKSAISIQPNATATLTATGEWSVSLRVPGVNCTSKTQLVTVDCLDGFVDVTGSASARKAPRTSAASVSPRKACAPRPSRSSPWQ